MICDLTSFIDAKTLVGTILGALLVWLGEVIKSSYNNSKKAHYLAMRLCPILEQFLDGCYDVAFDEGEEGADGCYHSSAKDPDLVLPNDVEWTSIDKKLLERIISLSTDYYKMKKNLAIEAEFNAHPPYDEIIYVWRVEFAKFSIKCEAILKDVRAILDLAPSEYPHGLNPLERCKEFLKQAEENKKKAEERHEKLMEEMAKVKGSK